MYSFKSMLSVVRNYTETEKKNKKKTTTTELSKLCNGRLNATGGFFLRKKIAF